MAQTDDPFQRASELPTQRCGLVFYVFDVLILRDKNVMADPLLIRCELPGVIAKRLCPDYRSDIEGSAALAAKRTRSLQRP